MSNFILAVHYGLDHDHIEYVEMTQGVPMHVTLTKDPTKATYRSLEEAKKWANDILRNGEGVGTWKIEVMPLEDASIKIDPELQATIGDLPEMTHDQSEGENSMTVEQHLDVAKVATREMQKLLSIARYQGQWTSTKALQHQAIRLGGTPDYMLRQFEAAIERIERNLNELGAINQRSEQND